MATQTKAEEWAVCVSSHCNPKMIGEVINEGQEFRADDPVVLFAPHLFRPKGTPRSEWPTPFDYAVATTEADAAAAEQARKERFEREARSNRVKLAAPKMLKLKADALTHAEDGVPMLLEKGSMIPESHPLVVEHPELFS